MIDAGDGGCRLNLLCGTRRVTLLVQETGEKQLYAEGRLIL